VIGGRCTHWAGSSKMICNYLQTFLKFSSFVVLLHPLKIVRNLFAQMPDVVFMVNMVFWACKLYVVVYITVLSWNQTTRVCYWHLYWFFWNFNSLETLFLAVVQDPWGKARNLLCISQLNLRVHNTRNSWSYWYQVVLFTCRGVVFRSSFDCLSQTVSVHVLLTMCSMCVVCVCMCVIWGGKNSFLLYECVFSACVCSHFIQSIYRCR